MKKASNRRQGRFLINIPVLMILLILQTAGVQAALIQMRDGRSLKGETAPVAKVDAMVEAQGEPQTKAIQMVDDGLRRIFVPKKNVISALPDTTSLDVFRFKQVYASSEAAGKYESLGDVRPFGPYADFDPYGRRTVALSGPDGIVPEIQMITEINSRYVRARGRYKNWDARYSILSFPQTILSPILQQAINPNVLEERLKLVRLYIYAEYFEAAEAELESIKKDFADDPKFKNNTNMPKAVARVQELSADRLEKELQLRSDAGQHQQVVHLLKTFPSDKGNNLTRQRVRRMLDNYESLERKKDAILARLDELAEKITDEKYKPTVNELLKEIRAEMNPNTLGRFDAFLFNDPDTSLSDEERLAIAMSAWLIGKETEVRRMTVAVSLFETRNLVRDYLRQKDFASAASIYEEIRKQEAGIPELVAAIMKTMKPPIETDFERLGDPEQPGFYRLERSGIAQEKLYETIRYSIQLPPEYDPNRAYPAIVVLHSNASRPDEMIQWWCGPWVNGARFGQASRNGYIVIAPHWAVPGQNSYNFSELAHAAVLYSLSDAVSRFNIDTDRVFLTGHAMGADAAWDIGAAHPDLWAGLILFGAVAQGQIRVYDDNLQNVPFYFVCGELESRPVSGRLRNLTNVNGPTFNYYLKKAFHATVVQYLGRGPEMYGEEILELFKWMKNLKRTYPKTFTVKSTRALSKFYFFWGMEYPKLPDEVNWPRDAKGNRETLETSYEYLDKLNKIKIKTKGRFANLDSELYLTPDMVQFNQRINVEFNGKQLQPRSGYVEPDLKLMLEDARTRKDRLHPFWVRLNQGTR